MNHQLKKSLTCRTTVFFSLSLCRQVLSFCLFVFLRVGPCCSENIGVTYAGMGPDFRVLVRRGRKATQDYFLQYVDNIPMTQLVREVGTVMQEFTQSGYSSWGFHHFQAR